MPLPLWAAFWGFVVGLALLIGAAVGYFFRVPQRVAASVMAFGSGVLISALAFELMQEAFELGGFRAAALGFAGGACTYTAANWLLGLRGARHRKRSGPRQAHESEQTGSGAAIALGALLDGVPESIAIGVSMLEGSAVSLVTVVAVFLSNLPEGLCSAAGMKQAGRSRWYVFGVWGSLTAISALASWSGYAIFGHFSHEVVAATTAVAAGAILAMLVDTMIPEAFAETHNFAGLITAAGFLVSFALSKLG